MSSFLEDEKNHSEYLRFENVKNPMSKRPDLHAFLLLDRLAPTTTPPGRTWGEDMVDSAGHDQIWLSADPEKVAEVATDEDLLDLIRCGVMFDDGNVSFCMFA